MESSEPYLSVECLSQSYRQGDELVPILNEVSFSARESDFVSILGPSGCGKTTLLNLVGGLDKPAAGSIRVGGTEITRLGPADLATYRREDVAFIFQFFNLFPNLTALENVEIGIELLPLPRSEVRDRAMDALAEVGLAAKAHRLPSHLSGGEQQRVAIARALAKQARLILADEPTGNLDQRSGETVMRLFERIPARGKTCILMITHDQRLALHSRTRLQMCDGRLKEGASS